MSDQNQDASGPLFAEEGQFVVEREGLEAGRIGAFVSVVLILLVLVVLAATRWFVSVSDTAHALVAAEATYPELRRVELDAEQLLSRYEVIDRAQGIYRIPVERAMDVLLRESHADTTTTQP